ncbi:unnamed protein product [Brachionus calyciflorus]|uniref:G-patch domain-containing protein n=1 Tax=Brachionus calyciflorus TaxID=104777 RepID=A0A813SA37_9BILA|nr:unnamed protein product [Brachionus calyciflorus]
MSVEKKTGFSFGFSKTKQKTQIVHTQAFKDETLIKTDEKIDLISSIDSKKITFQDKSLNEAKKPIVIPCPKNQTLIDKAKKSKEDVDLIDNLEKKLETTEKNGDAEAIKALIAATRDKKESKEDENLQIPIGEKLDEIKELEKVDEPNYEAIDLEQFGKAALRGMGWSEKSGIGLTNKRSFQVVEPELRPKGLGLGAGFNKKSKTDEKDSSENSNLKYRKGAYVEILTGKYQNEYGEILGFDDGLNRVLIKVFDANETVSLLQNFTKLISKSDYEALSKRRRR